jgi:hypothetical protein
VIFAQLSRIFSSVLTIMFYKVVILPMLLSYPAYLNVSIDVRRQKIIKPLIIHFSLRVVCYT